MVNAEFHASISKRCYKTEAALEATNDNIHESTKWESIHKL